MNHMTFSSVEAVGGMPDVEVEKVGSIFLETLQLKLNVWFLGFLNKGS